MYVLVIPFIRPRIILKTEQVQKTTITVYAVYSDSRIAPKQYKHLILSEIVELLKNAYSEKKNTLAGSDLRSASRIFALNLLSYLDPAQ